MGKIYLLDPGRLDVDIYHKTNLGNKTYPERKIDVFSGISSNGGIVIADVTHEDG